MFLYQPSSRSVTHQKSCLTCFHEVLRRSGEKSTARREGGPLECRVTQSSPLSPTSFTVKPQRLIKGSLHLLPEMMHFFPETPCKKRCKSNLMSSSAVWMSFRLKDSGRVPCGSVRMDQSLTEGPPTPPQSGLPVSLGSGHHLLLQGWPQGCLWVFTLASLRVQPWLHLKNLEKNTNTEYFCYVCLTSFHATADCREGGAPAPVICKLTMMCDLNRKQAPCGPLLYF